MFRTTIPIQPYDHPINYEHSLFMIGSCFTEHIGQRLQDYQLPSSLNPFGIVYNPLSIAQQLEELLKAKTYTQSDLIFHNEQWLSLDHHTQFSDPDYSVCLNNINQSIQKTHQQINDKPCLILTFGSAYAYQHLEQEKIVANCHKIPAKAFHKFRTTPAQIIAQLGDSLTQWKEAYPALRVLLTVSPVRHWRDGAIENQRSKATLLLAIAGLEEIYDWVDYFPSYEIMMDDLRDYRFYANDMLHPNETAVHYIWEEFMRTYIDGNCLNLMQRIGKLRQSLAHRVRNPKSKVHQQLLQRQLTEIADLEKNYNFLNFDGDKYAINQALTA